MWTTKGEPFEKIHNNRKDLYIACTCHCGTVRDVLVRDLESGKSKSCGCIRQEKLKKHQFHKQDNFNILFYIFVIIALCLFLNFIIIIYLNNRIDTKIDSQTLRRSNIILTDNLHQHHYKNEKDINILKKDIEIIVMHNNANTTQVHTDIRNIEHQIQILQDIVTPAIEQVEPEQSTYNRRRFFR